VVLADSGIIDFNLTGILAFLIFLVTIGLAWRWALGPISRVIQAREEKIEAGMRAAEEAQKARDEVKVEVARLLEEARNQAREVISRAHQEAAAEGEELRARARRDAEAQLEKARSDIQVERDRAIQELRTEMSALVVEAAGRVLGQTIDEKAHRRLIEESLHQVSAHD
jgi:F-type H+-transporting ATPase subunit b